MTKWYHTAIAETFGRENISIFSINLDLPIDQHGLMQTILTNNARQALNLFSIKDCTDSVITKVQQMMQTEVIEQCTKQDIHIREFVLKNTTAGALGSVMMYLIRQLY